MDQVVVATDGDALCLTTGLPFNKGALRHGYLPRWQTCPGAKCVWQPQVPCPRCYWELRYLIAGLGLSQKTKLHRIVKDYEAAWHQHFQLIFQERAVPAVIRSNRAGNSGYPEFLMHPSLSLAIFIGLAQTCRAEMGGRGEQGSTAQSF